MKKHSQCDLTKLYKAILTLKTEEECASFFNDICTFQEVEALAQRIEVAIRIKNKESYVDINKSTGASTATISKVSKYINYGAGGYDLVLERLKELEKND